METNFKKCVIGNEKASIILNQRLTYETKRVRIYSRNSFKCSGTKAHFDKAVLLQEGLEAPGSTHWFS